MPTQPSNVNPCNPVEQQTRQDRLDQLFRAAGRDRREHPMYARYTGLLQEWTAAQTPDAA